MSSEITVNLNLAYSDSEGSEESLGLVDFIASISSKKYNKFKVSIGFAVEEALPLGEATTPRYCVLINRDSTNYVEIKVATAGAIFARLDPGAGCIVPLGSGAQAPYAIANTAACQLEGFILNA